ncbi:MAG: hypothetical protein KDJ65_34650 [Anaerolineae bacterium]|nr:hypothetical protein [Anaerolineae bacterium]
MNEEAKVEYSDNPDFNEWLDSSKENTVTISGYSFPPSETLYRMNYDQYIEAYETYLEDDNILIETVYSDFPTPISFYIYQAQENYDNPHHRLDLLKSAWEALVFFLYGMILGESRHRKLPLKKIGITLNDFYSDRLATRLTIAENIFDYCTKNGYELSCSSLFSLDAISKLRDLNKKRNEFEHAFAATPDEQRNLYEALFPEMVVALKKLRELHRVNLFRFHSASDGGLLTPRCDVFRGHSLDGSKRLIIIPKEDFELVYPYFTAQSVFAQIEGENVFCLAPFIHFKKDPQDSHPRLTMYKKKISGGKYLYGIIGQSTQIEVAKASFVDRDNELRSLILEEGI